MSMLSQIAFLEGNVKIRGLRMLWKNNMNFKISPRVQESGRVLPETGKRRPHPLPCRSSSNIIAQYSCAHDCFTRKIVAWSYHAMHDSECARVSGHEGMIGDDWGARNIIARAK